MENVNATCYAPFTTEFSLAAKDRADQDRYLASAFSQLGNTVKDGQAAVSTDVTNAGTGLARDLCAGFAGLAREVASGWHSAELATEKTAAAGQLAVEKVGAAAALAAAMNTASVLAKIAECCCEAKADAAATRQLILEVEARRNAVELSDAKTRIAVLSGGK